VEPRATSALDADFRAFYATVPRDSSNALHPDAQHLRALYVLARSMQPMNILDLGSGYSTLALAAACRGSAWGRVAAVDGMAEWGARTTAMLAATGLSAWAKVIVREPVEVNVDGRRAWDFPDLPDSFFGPGASRRPRAHEGRERVRHAGAGPVDSRQSTPAGAGQAGGERRVAGKAQSRLGPHRGPPKAAVPALR
jgi:hypothetical protein